MSENNNSGMNVVMAVILILVVGVVAYLAYTAGFGEGESSSGPSIELNVPEIPSGGGDQ